MIEFRVRNQTMTIPDRGKPVSLGNAEAEFMWDEALRALATPRATSVDLENALSDISRLDLSPVQSGRLLDVACTSANRWLSTLRDIEPIEGTVFPYLTLPNDDQTNRSPLPATTQIFGELLAVNPNLYPRWRQKVREGLYGNPYEVLTGLLSRVTSQEYLGEHDFKTTAFDYVDLVKAVLKDIPSQDIKDSTEKAEMQEPIPLTKERLLPQAIAAIVTVDPDSFTAFTEGLEKRVLNGEYGKPEEVLFRIIDSVLSQSEQKGYEDFGSPYFFALPIVFDDLLITSREKAKELMPRVVETLWYWDRGHSFSYDVLQALDISGIPVGEEEEFVKEHTEAIEAAFNPILDPQALEQISREGTFAQRFTSVIGTVRKNDSFFRQITFDANPFDEDPNYLYIPDNVLVAALRNPEGFAQLPALETIALRIMRRLRNPKPIEERNSGMVRDMLAAENPLEAALKMEAKFGRTTV